MKFTILRVVHPQDAKIPVFMFYNAEGMLFGSVTGEMGQYGEDLSLVQRRAFIDSDSAIAWVKRKAENALSGSQIDWDFRDNTRVIQPANLVDIARFKQ